MMSLVGSFLVTLFASSAFVHTEPALLSCASEETWVETDFLFTEEKSCSQLIEGIDDWYNIAYRDQCASWMQSSVPDAVARTRVTNCFALNNGTVKYRTEICCEGTPSVPDDSRICFTCADEPVQRDTQTRERHTDRCNYYGIVQTCAVGEVCAVEMTYTTDAPWGIVTKSCRAKQTCEADQAANAQTCKDSVEPKCVYCYDQDYGNMEHPIQKLKAGGPCAGRSTPCGNRGTCVPDGESYTCECNPGRSGPLCRETACDLKLCKQRRSTCRTKNRAPYYRCLCRLGWTGQHCDERSPTCEVNSCLNGGTCYVTQGDDRCLCPTGFVGKLCEYPRQDECGDDSQQRTVVVKKNREKDNWDCTYINDVKISNYQSDYADQCFKKLYREYNPEEIYEPGVHGEFQEQQSISLRSCEQGEDYTWLSFFVCCASCGSNPCQNGGWCMQNDNDEGFTCRCRLGYGGFLCENKLDACYSTGDPHVYTFDGVKYDFQGLCKYTMTVNQGCEGLPDFRVLTRNEVRGTNSDVTYPMYVEVEVYGFVIRIDKGKIVTVNGDDVTASLPFVDPADPKRFMVGYDGMNVRVDVDFGLCVKYDGNWLIDVGLPSSASGCVDGICRTNDGDNTNEYILPDRTDLTDDPSGQSKLGNFYQVEDPDNPNCPARIQPNPPECDAATKAEIDSDTYCGQILAADGVFKSCVASVDAGTVQMFMENCQYDVCAVVPDGTDEMKRVACESLNVFATFCRSNEAGPLPDWRQTADCVPVCPGDLTYKVPTTACVPTCLEPDYPENCPFPNTENCVCPDSGHVMTPDNRCVLPEDCGCVEENRDIGDTWLNADCTERYTCIPCATCGRPIGEVQTEVNNCQEGEICQEINGQPECGLPPATKCEPEEPEGGCQCVRVPKA